MNCGTRLCDELAGRSTVALLETSLRMSHSVACTALRRKGSRTAPRQAQRLERVKGKLGRLANRNSRVRRSTTQRCVDCEHLRLLAHQERCVDPRAFKSSAHKAVQPRADTGYLCPRESDAEGTKRKKHEQQIQESMGQQSVTADPPRLVVRDPQCLGNL